MRPSQLLQHTSWNFIHAIGNITNCHLPDSKSNIFRSINWFGNNQLGCVHDLTLKKKTETNWIYVNKTHICENYQRTQINMSTASDPLN